MLFTELFSVNMFKFNEFGKKLKKIRVISMGDVCDNWIDPITNFGSTMSLNQWVQI